MAEMIDLTHIICADMPVYPGTEQPLLIQANTIEKDGFKETVLHMYSHTGTHTDSPAHLFEGGKSLDLFDMSELCGKAVILDVSDMSRDHRVETNELKALGKAFDEAEFLILKTGMENYWNDEKYFGNFPCLTREAAEYIVKCGKKGIGVDAISVDPVGERLEIHKILLGSGSFVIVENLCNLDRLPKEMFEFFIFPTKFAHSDGAPTRAAARCLE